MRNIDRHRHISIKLRFRWHDRWETLEAFDWSQVGFNFFSPFAIDTPLMELKRGLLTFEGSIVWVAQNQDDAVRLGFLVNELLYKAAKDTAGNPALHRRLVNLIRSQGLLAEKRKALELLGKGISDADLAKLLDKRKQEEAMYRYGVRVASESWNRIIDNALQVSSVVESLEKWSEAFEPKKPTLPG